MLTENIKHVQDMLPQFIKCNLFLTDHFRKKIIKENEIAKVHYHKCIDKNVQCGQGQNHNEEDSFLFSLL